MPLDLKLPSRSGTTSGTEPFAPTPPRVNLVPPQVAANAKAKARARLASGVTVLAIVSVAGMWLLGSRDLAAAETDLARAEVAQQTAIDELTRYSPVSELERKTSDLAATVAQATEGVVLHSDVLARFLTASAGLISPTGIQISTADTGRCVITDPFAEQSLIGCVTFTGETSGGADVASALVAALNADPWFSDAWIPVVGAETSMSGSVALTLEAREVTPEADRVAVPELPATEDPQDTTGTPDGTGEEAPLDQEPTDTEEGA